MHETLTLMTSRPATARRSGPMAALWGIRLALAGGVAAAVLDLGGTRTAAATWMASQIASAVGSAG